MPRVAASSGSFRPAELQPEGTDLQIRPRLPVRSSRMTVYVSMLRAVNVGGTSRIKMDALRAVYESIGLKDVRT